MYLETLPNWFWILYYLVLFITLGTAIACVVKKRMKGLSLTVIVFTFLVPIISLINSIGREEGKNEFEHLVSQFQQGAIWAIFVIIAYLFLFIWWVLFLLKSKAEK